MRSHSGFTLVECSVVCAVVALLAATALPSFQGQQLRSARQDAVNALTRLQAAQEQHRTHHGLYATELSALQGVSMLTTGGRYRLQLEKTGPEAYRARAVAMGPQSGDRLCPALTLDVNAGFATTGPDAACWNR